MNQKEKIQLLKDFLREYDLSFEDPFVKEFFMKRRFNMEDLKKQNFADGEAYGPIEPTIYRVTPFSFSNCGYFGGANEFVCLMDWLLYENMENNDLVFRNLGVDQNEIKASFERTRKLDGPAFADDDGHLLNGTDGNHRLLSLMLNAFVEYASAKSEEERNRVLAKYSMDIPVAHPHSKELCALLEKERLDFEPFDSKENSTTRIPFLVREYRALHQKWNELYVARYNPQTNMYTYDFNGTTFSGSCSDLVRFLRTKKKETRPIMFWNDGEYHYVSNNNFVFKSKNGSRVHAKFDEMKMKVYEDEKLKPYLVVYDADTGLYEIKTTQLALHESELSVRNEILNLGLVFTEHPANEQFFEILGLDRDAVLKELRDAKDYGFVAAFGPFHLENLTQKQAEFLQRKFGEIDGYFSQKVDMVNNSEEFKVFSEELFKLLPFVYETNQSLLGVSCGLVNNPRIKGSENSQVVVSAKRALEVGRLVPSWGVTQVLDRYKTFGKLSKKFESMPEIHADAKIVERKLKLEELFADGKKAFTAVNHEYILAQVVNIEKQIAQLEQLKSMTRDVEMKRHLEDMINILEDNLVKCERMAEVVRLEMENIQPGGE